MVVMALLPCRFVSLLLATCSVGLSCSAVVGPSIAAPPAAAAVSLLAQMSPTEKASPYAAAKEDGGAPGGSGAEAMLQELEGTRAAGTTKQSPFAGAKESDAATSAQLRVDRRRLWWLRLPLSLAAVSYAALLSQEGEAA
jgi:hypothetical protein